jgi:hypothetical protein
VILLSFISDSNLKNMKISKWHLQLGQWVLLQHLHRNGMGASKPEIKFGTPLSHLLTEKGVEIIFGKHVPIVQITKSN